MERIEKTITVDVPVKTCYDQWTQFESFPQFMEGVKQVDQLDDKRLRWVAEVAGDRKEWTAEIREGQVRRSDNVGKRTHDAADVRPTETIAGSDHRVRFDKP